MATTIDILIGNKFLNDASKYASEIILKLVKLPEGSYAKENTEIINTSYLNLELVYRLQRAKIYEDLADANTTNNIKARFRFYACYELLMVLHRIEGEKILDSLYPSQAPAADRIDFTGELKEVIKGKLQELIENAQGEVSEEITDIDAYLANFLTKNNPSHIGEKLSKLQTETASAIFTTLKPQIEAEGSKRLILVTDLYRDIDDWLTLLHAVTYGKYDEIIIIASNEVEGECARITESYIAHLKNLAKALHNKEISIKVCQGLPAFDFAPFHPDHQDQYPGIHYPPKTYSAHMRIPSGGDAESLPKKLADLYADMSQWDKKHTDLVNIAKTADLDMVLLLLKSRDISPEKVVMLGARQDTFGTNTNGDPFHLQNLPEGLILLDSSYGALIDFYFNKADFIPQDADNQNQGEYQFARFYLNKYMELLDELAGSPLLSMQQKQSITLIKESTLRHIENMQYDRGNAYDLFTLIPLFFSNHFKYELKQIAYRLSIDNSNNENNTSEYLERAKCSLLSTVENLELITSLAVIYPSKQSVKSHFEEELTQKLDLLSGVISEQSQATAPQPEQSAISPVIKSLQVSYPDKPHLQANFINYLLELLNPLLQKADAQKKLDLDELIKKFPESEYYDLRNTSSDERAKKTSTGLDEGMRIARSFLILGALVDQSLTNEQAAKLIAGGFPEAKSGKFDPIDISGKEEQCSNNVKILREMLKKLDLYKVIRGYIAHDLGKTFRLIAEYFLSVKDVDPAAHDVILEAHLKKHPELKEIFDNPELRVFIDFLDLLGHSPWQIFDPKLKLLYTCANVYKQTHDLKNNVLQGNAPEIETRRSINRTFRDKTKDLELTQHIDIDSIDVKIPYSQLPTDTQKKLAFLMWTGGLRISSPGNALTEFTQAWENPANAKIIEEMTALLMKNLEQEDGYCMLYNVTGLLHKTEAGKVKAFIGAADKGGMGGTLSEVITVAFPLILKCCRGEKVVKQSEQPDKEFLSLRKEDSKVGYNAFQVLQMIEMLQNLLPGLAELTTGKNIHPTVDFGSLDANQLFAEALLTAPPAGGREE